MRSVAHAVRVLLTTFLIGAAPAAQSAPSPHPAPQTTPLPDSPSRGAEIYEAKCGACHSLDFNRVGPKHRGVFGRRAASVPGFHYSSALKKLNVTWNATTLDRWLQNPTAMAPGTAMGFRLSDQSERADVIAYLRQQSAQHK